MANYKTYRDLHLWIGLILLVPVSVIAATGFLWNHEKALGIKTEYEHEMMDKHPAESVSEDAQPTFTASPNAWRDHATSIDQALVASKDVWGEEVELERIELKQEPGYGLVVKVKAPKEADVRPEEIIWSVSQGEIIAKKGDPKAGTDWAKVVHDLHTGKFFSDKLGFLWSDSGALAILFLGATGVILYTIPYLKKRAKSRKMQAATSAAVPAKANALTGSSSA